MTWQAVTDDTAVMEIPGLGVVLRSIPAPGEAAMVFVPGARVLHGRLVRDQRTDPPLVAELTADEIRERQGHRNPDPGSAAYFVATADGEY